MDDVVFPPNGLVGLVKEEGGQAAPLPPAGDESPDSGIEDAGQAADREGSGQKDSGQEDSGQKDSDQKSSDQKDSGQEDSGLKGSDREDSGRESLDQESETDAAASKSDGKVLSVRDADAASEGSASALADGFTVCPYGEQALQLQAVETGASLLICAALFMILGDMLVCQLFGRFK